MSSWSSCVTKAVGRRRNCSGVRGGREAAAGADDWAGRAQARRLPVVAPAFAVAPAPPLAPPRRRSTLLPGRPRVDLLRLVARLLRAPRQLPLLALARLLGVFLSVCFTYASQKRIRRYRIRANLCAAAVIALGARSHARFRHACRATSPGLLVAVGLQAAEAGATGVAGPPVTPPRGREGPRPHECREPVSFADIRGRRPVSLVIASVSG